MYISSLLLPKEELTTVTPNDSIKKALDIIEEKDFLSVPVVDGEKFYGSISKGKIYTFFYEKSSSNKAEFESYKVRDIMRTDIPVVNLMDLVEKAARYLETKRIAFVAVEDEFGKFQGIITHHSIFHMFNELFGFNQGKRLSVIAYDIPGQISKLTRIISENKGDIISLTVTDPKTLTDVKEIVMRIRCDMEKFNRIKAKLRASGFKLQ